MLSRNEPEEGTLPTREFPFGVSGSKNTTAELLRFLVEDLRTPPRALITLTPEQGRRFRVAGYADLTPIAAELGIAVFHPRTYTLALDQDGADVRALGLVALLVQGWQRLIPEWFLSSLPHGAYGMHGSSERLPRGRGRSPLNWSLIQGRSSFTTNLFRYEPGVDDGNIVGRRSFDITPTDTAHTLHLKNTYSMLDLLRQHLPEILEGRVLVEPQDAGEPTYYPKRRPEDGEIFWEDSATEIGRFVRALTRPFPAAFTHLNDGSSLKIWRAETFLDSLPSASKPPGCVLGVTSTGELIVQTGSGSLLVQDWEAPRSPETGEFFTRRTAYRWDWSKLPMSDPAYCGNYEEIPEAFRRFA